MSLIIHHLITCSADHLKLNNPFPHLKMQYPNNIAELQDTKSNDNSNLPVANENHARAYTAPVVSASLPMKPSAAIDKSPTSPLLLKKAAAKALKASRDFYQKNSNAISIVASVILGAGMQVLLASTQGEQYSYTQSLLFLACALEGLSLFFSNLIMMVSCCQSSSLPCSSPTSYN